MPTKGYIVRDTIEGKEYRAKTYKEVANIVARSEHYVVKARFKGKIVAGRYKIEKEGEE